MVLQRRWQQQGLHAWQDLYAPSAPPHLAPVGHLSTHLPSTGILKVWTSHKFTSLSSHSYALQGCYAALLSASDVAAGLGHSLNRVLAQLSGNPDAVGTDVQVRLHSSRLLRASEVVSPKIGTALAM